MPVILGFMLVDTNAMIFGMPTALFPALATHRFHDPSLVGYLYAATYAGALARVACSAAGSTTCAARDSIVVVAASLWGAAIAAFGFATQLWVALLLLAIAGGADLVSAVLRGTMLLELTPDSLRGRLTGIEFAQVASAPSLGNLEAGVRRVGHEHPHVDRLRRDLLRVRLLRARARVPGPDPLRLSCP